MVNIFKIQNITQKITSIYQCFVTAFHIFHHFTVTHNLSHISQHYDSIQQYFTVFHSISQYFTVFHSKSQNTHQDRLNVMLQTLSPFLFRQIMILIRRRLGLGVGTRTCLGIFDS